MFSDPKAVKRFDSSMMAAKEWTTGFVGTPFRRGFFMPKNARIARLTGVPGICEFANVVYFLYLCKTGRGNPTGVH